LAMHAHYRVRWRHGQLKSRPEVETVTSNEVISVTSSEGFSSCLGLFVGLFISLSVGLITQKVIDCFCEIYVMGSH